MEKKIPTENRPDYFHVTECAMCGCTPKPDEWSSLADDCCFDCA